jgi:hypothetical protein
MGFAARWHPMMGATMPVGRGLEGPALPATLGGWYGKW